MGTILASIKEPMGIDPDNLGFDNELLAIVNSVKATLVQNGVSQFAGMVIDKQTTWPAFTNPEMEALVQQFIIIKTRQLFDPIPSETISKIMNEVATQYEGRIAYQVEEDAQ